MLSSFELECPLCLEEYVNNDNSENAPKILPCGHTLCCRCIKQIKKKYNNQIICPIDRKKDNISFKEIPFNRLLYDLILKKQKINQQKKEFENQKYDYSLKIGMLGNNYVGKTSLLHCYQYNKPISDNNLGYTLSVDYFLKIINFNGKKIQIIVLDTVGQEKFNSITSRYLRDLHGCFIVYDVTDNDSFNSLDNWIQLYNDFNKYKKRIMVILGNKADKKERTIKSEEGKEFAIKRDLPYFETSSKTMQNLNGAFEKMIKMILDSENENNLERSRSEFGLKYNRQNKGCCI